MLLAGVLTPEVLESLSDSLSSKHSDLRRGVISVAIGIALFIFAQLIGEPDAEGPMRALAAFPLLLGIAYLGLWYFLKRKQA